MREIATLYTATRFKARRSPYFPADVDRKAEASVEQIEIAFAQSLAVVAIDMPDKFGHAFCGSSYRKYTMHHG